MKTALKIALIGALAGSSIVAWISPTVITWYFNPPVEMPVTCKDAVAWGIGTYQQLTLGSAIISGVLTLIVYLVYRKRRGGGMPNPGNSAGPKLSDN
jgi:hypothetical protein